MVLDIRVTVVNIQHLPPNKVPSGHHTNKVDSLNILLHQHTVVGKRLFTQGAVVEEPSNVTGTHLAIGDPPPPFFSALVVDTLHTHTTQQLDQKGSRHASRHGMGMKGR